MKERIEKGECKYSYREVYDSPRVRRILLGGSLNQN